MGGSLLAQKPLLQCSESVEGIEGRHGEEVHLSDFFQHRMGGW